MNSVYDYYITPQEYELAAQNGIDPHTLERRIRLEGWSKSKAINTPKRRWNDRQKWVNIAKQNGIGYQTFMTRVNKYGWSEEKAATRPLQDRIEHARKLKEKYRVIPKDIVDLAKSNGVSYQTLRARIRKGCDPVEAATKPIMSVNEAGKLGAKRLHEKYGDIKATIFGNKKRMA